MEKTVESLSRSIVGIRSGTTTSSVINTVKVDCYGQNLPIVQVAQTGRLENIIYVDPYDVSLIGSLLIALKSNGFSAYQFSKSRVVVSVPHATGEEKEKIKKHLYKLGEEAKVSIRSIRKSFRKSQEDRDDKEIQKITDKYIDEIDSLIKNKVNNL